MNPLPVLLSPFEVSLTVDRSLTLTSNVDMHKSRYVNSLIMFKSFTNKYLPSVEIVPTYNNQYKMTYKSDNAEVTKELEFTMTDNMIEYGQFKIWKEGNSQYNFQYMTDFGVPQTLSMFRSSNFVSMNFDVRSV